jgi:hypothetical protein
MTSPACGRSLVPGLGRGRWWKPPSVAAAGWSSPPSRSFLWRPSSSVWTAGVSGLPYRLITSYENMRTCKPMPGYYLEIASVLDCPPEDCLMVGNDLDQDITPAQRAGMATYWVTNSTAGVPSGRQRGALAHLSQLLSEADACAPD